MGANEEMATPLLVEPPPKKKKITKNKENVMPKNIASNVLPCKDYSKKQKVSNSLFCPKIVQEVSACEELQKAAVENEEMSNQPIHPITCRHGKPLEGLDVANTEAEITSSINVIMELMERAIARIRDL